MIQKESYLNIVDNSGGIFAKCIHIYGKKKVGRIGDKILITVKKVKKKRIPTGVVRPRARVEMHIMYKAIILSTKFGFSRADGRYFRSDTNDVVLLSRVKESLIGTRIMCSVSKEFRNLKLIKYIILGVKFF